MWGQNTVALEAIASAGECTKVYKRERRKESK